MFARILVPLDGSERAERALAVAGRLARASHGLVILLRVVNDIPDTSALLATAPLPHADYLDRDEREARQYLDAVVSAAPLRGVRVETRVEFGISAEIILDSASAFHADAIVLCSHGRTGLTRWALGSVAQQIVRRATIPTVLLRERGGLPGPAAVEREKEGVRLFRMLIPLDGSELAEAALEPAISFGALMMAPDDFEIHLVRILPFIRTQEYDALREQAALEASAYLERIAKRIGASPDGAHAHVTTGIVYDLDVAAALSRIAEASPGVVGTAVVDGCDMIAMATHGRTGLARLAMGSVTDRALSATTLPALIVRPQIIRRSEDDVVREREEASPEPSVERGPHPWEALF
jgi:nucleotide-binding universal stress UspA family protein